MRRTINGAIFLAHSVDEYGTLCTINRCVTLYTEDIVKINYKMVFSSYPTMQSVCRCPNENHMYKNVAKIHQFKP